MAEAEADPKEENESSYQRYKILISSLPKDEGWAFENYFCHYQGFWYPDTYCPGVLAVQDHFKARSSDIIVATTPKSGTTWIKALLFAAVNRGMYPPTYNHHPYMIDSSSRIVYLYRNPKDVFVSMWHFNNKIRATVSKPPLSAMEAFERFCKGVSQFGPFWDHVLVYWRASLERPQQVLFINYEKLQADPGGVLKRVAHFVGFPFTSEEEKEQGLVDKILRLCSFENLSSLEVNKTGKIPEGLGYGAFFRKGKVGDWANYLTSEMIERIDQITEEKFHGHGLKF
ncbi:cytosolic sulfotransferase 6-like [Macadamia integrifolia]|uniref:cytosolic sulfotransferase 6-like n=1 Tax=Macadamia integrifolia TaxID=60698 RepID=UPI001C531575|nr:cytosolic sulfotransferase 6-like [Macadamia integrifolia]